MFKKKDNSKTQKKEKSTKKTEIQDKYFAKFNHNCDVITEGQFLQELVPGYSLRAKFVRWWYKKITISEKRVTGVSGFKSYNAFQKEKKRHLSQYPYVIHPYSDFTLAWKILVCCCIVIHTSLVSSTFTYRHFFTNVYGRCIRVVRMTSEYLLIADLIVNFLTGYYCKKQKEVVFSVKQIAKNYVSGRFIFQLITYFPVFNTGSDIFANDPVTIVQITLIYLRYFAYFTFCIYVKNICRLAGYRFYTSIIFLSIFFSTFMRHIASVIYRHFYLYSFKNSTNDDGIFLELSFFESYISSLHHASHILSVSGMGRLEPASILEEFATIISWVFAEVLVIILIGAFLMKLTAQTSSKQKYVFMLQQIKEYMNHQQLPLYLKNRIISYYKFKFKERFFSETNIMNTLSGQLKQDIVMHSCKTLVENVVFFKNLPTYLVVKIVSCLKGDIYMTNDVIIRANTRGEEMYFILSGSVAIYTPSGQEICHLSDGSHFGEIALLKENGKRIASVVAVEISEIYSLDRSNFIKAIHPYPDLMDHIARIAADRTDRTPTLNEQHRKQQQSKQVYEKE